MCTVAPAGPMHTERYGVITRGVACVPKECGRRRKSIVLKNEQKTNKEEVCTTTGPTSVNVWLSLIELRNTLYTT